jgi:restriction system protein
MQGRAERGIFLATSKFTAEAEREATRAGASPVQLVDLETLISLLTELKLGVRTVLAVDHAFFADYMPAGLSDSSKTSNAISGAPRRERVRNTA